MIIVGLTGGIGHGKTTFAELLAAQCRAASHFETWELVAEIANALKSEAPLHPNPNDIAAINDWLITLLDIVSLHVHTDLRFQDLQLTEARLKKHPDHYEKLFEYLQTVAEAPELATTVITNDNKETFRPLLQWLGGYLVARAGSGIWYDELIRRISHLRSAGTELITVGGVRYPSDAERLRNLGAVIIEIQRPDMPDQDSQDLTERQRKLIKPDVSISNNGNLTDLASVARQLCTDLQLRQLQGNYQADTAISPAA